MLRSACQRNVRDCTEYSPVQKKDLSRERSRRVDQAQAWYEDQGLLPRLEQPLRVHTLLRLSLHLKVTHILAMGLKLYIDLYSLNTLLLAPPLLPHDYTHPQFELSSYTPHP